MALFMLLVLAVLVPANAQAKPPDLGPPPFEGDCLGFTEPRGCFYAVRNTTFDLNRHIYRVGDTVVGSGASPEWKEASMQTFGPGLKFNGCKGKPHPGPVSCRWKAKAQTHDWQWNTMGINIAVPGSAQYLDSTFYAVVGDDPSIEGYVRTPDGRGVDDAVVRMKGPQTYTAKTDEKGYYYRFVMKGDYVVAPTK